ncbi:MAG: histidine--tRNA ligase [Clostridia bacterium]|nr:histidine--tRNA ligase [Clostridia bacterium]MBQ4608007.1 histidine--tRNA ligase [Clostridia bacterium]MBQ6858463.1 histidine--tRNA ligase [Clostridia bacterium]MBQ7051818.1 histidine--tRNA ligase [Clostridia bacterium]
MKFIKTPVKGMLDMLPSDMRLREHVFSMIKKSYGAYGFMQIETPIVEHIENLTSKQGGDNEKLIFKVMKRGADLQRAIDKGAGEYADNGLRYDLTVPLARYYANNKEHLPTPFKALQMGNVYRADNPQKGRFRQFTQCDIDILGDGSSLAEIELITATAAMLTEIFAEIGITDFTIHLNDRQMLSAVALSAGFKEEEIGSVLISLDKFDKIGLDGIEAELLEGGYDPEVVGRYLSVYRAVEEGVTIEAFCRDISRDVLSEKVIANLSDILECVRPMLAPGVKIVFDPTLVRGMGYYTGPIFEITMDDYNFSIAGGGRYDKMIGKFSGQDVAASGFSIGFERIITILKDHMQGSYKLKNATAFLIDKRVSTARKTEVIARAMELRKEGAVATVLPMAKNVGNQIKLLENEGYDKFEKIYE